MTASTPKIELSVLVIAYNSREFIGDCLEAIERECRDVSFEVLLIDNGSDGTAELVAGRFPQLRVVPSFGNIGFARANNALAHESEGRLLLLVNPDAVLCEGSIAALLDGQAKHSEAAAWGGVTLDDQGQPDTGNAIPVPSLREFASSALGRSAAGSLLSEVSTEDERVDLLSGGFLMIDRQAWEEVGGFDESFFLYCEEVDLFTRLGERGHHFWRIGSARAHHRIAHGDSLSPLRSLYRTAGSVHYVRKHWPSARVWLGIALIWWAAFARFVAGSLFGWANGRLAQLSDGYAKVALKPGLWIYGYHPKRGLKAQLDRAAL